MTMRAYWDAGYAEGLGKLVISICPQAKFDAAKTHFHTNPCTTVMWRVEEAVAFTKSLVATPQTVAEFFAYAA